MMGMPGMRSVVLPTRAFVMASHLRVCLRFHKTPGYRMYRFAVADCRGGYVDAA